MTNHYYKLLTLVEPKAEGPHGYIFRKDHALGPITNEDINVLLKIKKSPPLEKIKHSLESLTSKKASQIQQLGFHEVVNIVAIPPVIKTPNSIPVQKPAYA